MEKLNRYFVIKNLVEDFKNRRKNKRLLLITSLIENYKKTNLYFNATKYNLFDDTGLKLSEEQTNNVITSIFNPQKLPFGKPVIIDILRKKGGHHIATIIEATKEENLKVKREQKGSSSRIDIRIITENSSRENAIVDA